MAGEYTAAGTAFDAANSVEPDNEIITFDQACTLTAQGELDQAKDLFHLAALARETGLSSDAYYNLGNLTAVSARETLGDDPVNVDLDKREEVISGLLSAVGHYRDCLRTEFIHAQARHNLELIRLFIKHIQEEWEQRDREKAREELGLLEFLAMIEQQQHGVRTVVQMLTGEDDSPQQRQAVRETADSQRQLHGEIGPLKEKIVAELQPQSGQQPHPAQQPPQASDQQRQKIEMFLGQLAGDAGDGILKAADEIESADLKVAQQTQRDTLDLLNEIFMIVAPFAKVLERAIPVQEGLVQKSETITESSGLPPGVGPDEHSGTGEASLSDSAQADLPGIDPEGTGELAWQQSRISDWGRLLSLKAEGELPQAEAQVEAMANQVPDESLPSPDDDSAEEATSSDPTAQLKSLVESLQNAIELAPQIEELSVSAEQYLTSAAVDRALPDQQEALRLLKEIAKPLSDQNDQDKQQQDEQNQNSEQDQQQNEQSEKNDQQEQQQKSSKERAESVLRRAREREREHRDREKEFRKILGGLIPVDKDW